MIVAKMNPYESQTKRSRAVEYDTFGRSVRASRPKNVMVRTVVMPGKEQLLRVIISL